MENIIAGKNIVLGVCGGIAAYKSVELLRLLKKQGARVRVIMTRNAQWFVGPLTFEALSEQPVCTDLFEKGEDGSIRHISWAEAADMVVIAPATANIIGKLAHGVADDALTTFMLAVTAPKLICPAMNTRMYENRVVQRNLDVLEGDGYRVVEPGAGSLACGTVGPGRLPDPREILDRMIGSLVLQDFLGKKVLVTAGPTHEPLDPVRFIGNPSSGKMGYALARAAALRGGEVVLVTGPTALPVPVGVTAIRVQTAQEMAEAVFGHMENTDIIIKAAAVSDYRPVERAPHKIKKQKERMMVSLERTPDILRELGRRKTGQLLVGFAAETQALAVNAKKKLVAKNLDLIVGNLVGEPDTGFGADTNTITLFFKDGKTEAFERMEKDAVAHLVLDRILSI